MIKKVNRNFLWSEIFIEQLVQHGIKYACISPGSRSAPLTYSLAKNKNIKCCINIDERSSAFFALGLAKASSSPVVIVTTSGTATAELYPAIIEAFQQRSPLIVCTADRPPELKNSGTNQMINQKNIYRNHIRWFKDAGLPELTENKLFRLVLITHKAINIAAKKDKGPVHLNFPFRKPLEPGSFTDEIDESIIVLINKMKLASRESPTAVIKKRDRKIISKIASRIFTSQRGLIVAGPQDYNPKVIKAINSLSEITGFPVLADGASQLRFNSSNNLVISNYDAYLRSEIFIQKFRPDVILQFGRTVTSTFLENYFEESEIDRFLINEYGDRFDPSGKAKSIVKFNPEIFCDELIKYLKEINFKKPSNEWSKIFHTADMFAEEIKSKIIYNSSFPNEARIIPELIKIIPSQSSIVVGNSLPIRDLEFFTTASNKGLKIFFNRGASGIDGITSTALGIAKHNKSAVLITGDLSFLHDINALLAANKNPVSLVIVLINNNGGGIFDMLPIKEYGELFRKYFKTPHDRNIKSIVEAFGHNHIQIESWNHLAESVITSMQKKSLTVLEIKTNSISSHKLREKYWNLVKEKINSEFS